MGRAAYDHEQIQAYYDLAGTHLHVNGFENELAKTVWELHVQGISVRRIAKQLKKGRYVVWSIIRKHQAKCGVKKPHARFTRKSETSQ